MFKIKKLTDSRWLNLFEVFYKHKTDKEKSWVMCSRKARPITDAAIADAVVIIPIIKTQSGNRLVVTKEFRAPIWDYEYGFPAGLIDDGEDIAQTAARELREETGLEVAKVNQVSMPVYSSSGMTDESCHMVIVEATGNGRHKGNADYENKNRRNRKIGERGELIVLQKEKEFLQSISRSDLVNKIKHVSKTDDSAGYDILSFDKNGNKKYIEVKSTKDKIGKTAFFVSIGEVKTAQSKDNYFIYLVFETHTNVPKIFKARYPFSRSEEQKIIMTPVNYRVEINVSSHKSFKNKKRLKLKHIQ